MEVWFTDENSQRLGINDKINLTLVTKQYSCYKYALFKKIRDLTYVKGYGFLSFAANMEKSLGNKCSQKRLDSTKNSTTDAIKTAAMRAIQKKQMQQVI